MGEGFLKSTAGKIVSAVLAVGAIIIIVWYVRLTPAEKATIWSTARGVLVWTGCVAALPWATFFVPPWVVRRFDSNVASGVMLGGYLAADVALALGMVHGHETQGWHKAALLFGFLCAAVYNFVVCEFLAGRAEDS